MLDCLIGLNHLHALEIAHRDLKPENIMQAERRCKLIDFGLSKIFNKEKKSKSYQGTIHYIAPEVIDSHHDKRCDLWSIGVITYELLSGEKPFNGRSEDQIERKI